MLTLVLAGNFLVLLVGWQGMAVCSYLLIGFWFDRQASASGATTAFVVHWIGDWGLVVAIFLAYFTFGTLDFRELAASVTSLPVEVGTFGAISGICLGLWIAALAKSAQIPLHVWLPAAADGPAPALALIQTSTTLTAGVFVIARNAALFERAPVVMTIVATLGVLTAIMAAGLALVQTDIKRVVVYSTISQLGVIFTALGVGAFSAAIFHLVSIGLSQSLLFIGSSTVTRVMDGERDMHRMGGLRQYMPATFVTMMVGALAVTGIPPLSGFFSATQISSGMLAGHRLLWVVSCATAILTAVYMSRLMLLTFYGTYRGSARTWPDPNSREAPLPVVVTLMTLAVATIVLGFIGISIPGHAASIVQLLTSAATADDPKRSLSTVWILAVLLVAVLLPFAGIAIARRLYQRDPGMDLNLSRRWPDGQALLANQYYFDELYAATLMSGIFTTARGLARFDDRVINAVVIGCAWMVQIAGWIVHMIERYVVDRIADLFVSGFGVLVFRFRFLVPVRGFGSRFLVASQPRTTNDKPKPRT
jgi:NADH-quinone oxidoreductase subunit L